MTTSIPQYYRALEPTLIVGDVHGDLERLFRALKPYPPEHYRTIFLGDLVDGGAFGVGALRYARDRPRTAVLLGNHEVAMLWALHDRATLPLWTGMGGQPHDLQELRRDEALQHHLEQLPVLLRLEDGTLCQHTDTDLYARLAADGAGEGMEAAVNRAARDLVARREFAPLWDVLSGGGAFRGSERRLAAWLERTGSRRLVHGHVPHRGARPDAYHGGRAIDFDGSFSRFYGSRYTRRGPVGATVAPLVD